MNLQSNYFMRVYSTWSLKAVTQVLPLSSMIDMFTM